MSRRASRAGSLMGCILIVGTATMAADGRVGPGRTFTTGEPGQATDAEFTDGASVGLLAPSPPHTRVRRDGANQRVADDPPVTAEVPAADTAEAEWTDWVLPDGTPAGRMKRLDPNAKVTRNGPTPQPRADTEIYLNEIPLEPQPGGGLVGFIFARGDGERVADDLVTAAVTPCALSEVTVGVGGLAGESFTVDICIWDGCPGDDGEIIYCPDPEYVHEIEENEIRLISVFLPPGTIPPDTTVWVSGEFDSDWAGFVWGAPPTLGFSHDGYDDPVWACTCFFGGFPDYPHASFWAKVSARGVYETRHTAYMATRVSGVPFAIAKNMRHGDDITLADGFEYCELSTYELGALGWQGLCRIEADLREGTVLTGPGAVIPGTERIWYFWGDGRLEVPRFSFADLDPPIMLPQEFWITWEVDKDYAGVLLVGDVQVGHSDDAYGWEDPDSGWIIEPFPGQTKGIFYVVVNCRRADCNHNSVEDGNDIAGGTSEDCNVNDVPDECEPGGQEGCNANGIPDLCDIHTGTSPDCNDNTVPDECDGAPTGTLYVDESATDGANDGSSWADAYLELPEAMRYAECASGAVTEIWIARGVYTPDPTGMGKPREATFQLVTGVTLEGGYAGCGAPDPDARDVALYETILSGDIGTPDDNSDNCYHVVTGSGTDATAVLDGFTINRGNADDYSTQGGEYGGGMYNNDGSPTVTNCTFRGNSANYGGGMYNYNSSPTVANCTFTGNSTFRGAGMYNHDSSPTVTNCTFGGNQAKLWGGGMYNSNSSPTVTNCAFSRNWARSGSGGMYNYNSSPAVTNCTFAGNRAGDAGAGMYNDRSNPTVANCTFTGNSTSGGGGGMYNESTSEPTVANCTFTGNAAGAGGGGMYDGQGSSPTVTDCAFRGNSANYGGGMFHVQGNPTLMNCTFSGNSANSGAGMYTEHANATFVNCTFVGNSAGSGAGIYSWRGTSAVANCTFAANRGAYGHALTCDSYTVQDFCTVELANCILWDGGDELWYNDYSIITMTSSDVEGGWPGVGNIDADPRFVAYGYWDDHGTPEDPGDDLWVDGDYHLQAGSACIDAGDNAAVPPEAATDLDGNPRITDGDGHGLATVDMGAYESPTRPLTTDLDVIPGGCPNSWDPTAGETLGAAIVGVEWLDSRKIDPDSLSLIRADGAGEAVPPIGDTGPSLKDLAGPREDGADECSGSGPDGILDLEIRFEAEKVMDGLKLGDMPADARIDLTLRGALLDGTRFEASDYVVIADPPPYLPRPGSLRQSDKTGAGYTTIDRGDGK